MKLFCQGQGVLAFAADVLPAFAGGGVVYFREKRQWAATGNHTMTGAELCHADKTVDGFSLAQIEELKQQIRSGVDVDGRKAVLEDIVFDGTWTNGTGVERLFFVGCSAGLGMMQSSRYVPSQSRWASV